MTVQLMVADAPVLELDADVVLTPADFEDTWLLVVQEGLVILRAGPARGIVTCHAGPGAVVLPPRDDEVLKTLTPLENLGLFARLYRVHERGERIGMLLERFQLWDARHQRVSTFSRGMQQRLALCRVLLHEPQLLVLDEPFNALDADGAALLDRTLLELRDRTLVVATHDPARLERLATDRLVFA